ncbi:MAG: DUF418 domain-containing protein [Rhodoferax sp.]
MQERSEIAVARLAPITERIEALDVVRGFALLGIFLMNIEFFNRAMNGIGMGMPEGLTGLNWLASWFILYFVQGKFWTIFSLLFGMGFAVMLTRAQDAGRGFLGPYLRRILALAAFGAAHYIFLWGGDILFSYAIGALMLLVMLYGNWKYGLAAVVALVGIGIATKTDDLFGVAGMLTFTGVLALYLRGERNVTIRGRSWPLFSVILMGLGAVTVLAIAVTIGVTGSAKGFVGPVGTLGVFGLVLGWLSSFDHGNVAKRPLRLGVAVYMLSFTMMSIGGAVQYFSPRSSEALTVAAAASAAEAEKAAKEAKRLAERKEERAKQRAEREAYTAKEVRIYSSGTYLEAVELRARKFPGKVMEDFGFGTVLAAIFLIGSWFIRSGVMVRPQDHLDLFKRMALWGLPIGIGMGLLGSLIAVRATPGLEGDGYQLAHGLAMMGNLPACLGYVGLVVWLLHGSAGTWLRTLAPAGRMALTNYLMQSVLCSFIFYGYGLGWWGMPRSQQVVFVLVVYALQLAFSHWWLARFRLGPMEWVWRSFTYREYPLMRRLALA